MPFFSVVIPTYNRANFIRDTVESVLKQDHTDFEILVVDDGSTDNTETVIAEAFGNTEQVRYFKQVNAERGAARNKGIREARGEYVLFLDSDDQMRTNHLSALREIIRTHPGVNYLATKYEFIRNGQITPAPLSGISEGEYSTDFFLGGAYIGAVVCVRKGNPNLRLFEEDRRYATSEDWMFLVQNLVNDKIYIAEKFTVLVNDHDERSMRSDNQEVISRKLLAKEWVKQNVALSQEQIKTLESHTYYFCAIHSYLDHRRRDALKYAYDSIKIGGFNARLARLVVKSLLGRGFVQKLKAREPRASPVT